MAVLKVKKIATVFVKKNYPELYTATEKIEGLSELQKQQVYGLCIDAVEKSDGLITVFEDEDSLEEDINIYD